MYLCFSRSDTSYDFSDDSESQDEDDQYTEVIPQPCRYYNRGGCRESNRCLFLHICQYALRGNCRNGSNCPLSHDVSGEARTRAEHNAPGDTHKRKYSAEIVLIKCTMLSVSKLLKYLFCNPGPTLTNGRIYQWQLYDGNSWMDIENNHVIEALYSLPENKGVKLYNLPYG